MYESDEQDEVRTRPVTQEERVILVQSLLVTWDVLDHLQQRGAIADQAALRDAGGCCRPDGGTCCVNKQSVVEA
jgi:hypothetical protein